MGLNSNGKKIKKKKKKESKSIYILPVEAIMITDPNKSMVFQIARIKHSSSPLPFHSRDLVLGSGFPEK